MPDHSMESVPVVILCGGQGTRMRGQTLTKKELVTIGGRPIIWHVMRIFSAYDFSRFVLTLGYHADQMRRYFLDYEAMDRDFTILLGNHEDKSSVQYRSDVDHPFWEVSLVDTGLHTEKAGRISKVAEYLKAERFFVAYGDDVSDVDLSELLSFHRQHGKLATLTAVRIQLPFGVVEADDSGQVYGFVERPLLPYWINGGFMIFENPVLEMMNNEKNANLEKEILPQLAQSGQLMIYRHSGFWQSMNTMKDNIILEELWQNGAPWKVW